ncbi:hypothetical protein LV192_002599 [Vibrio mimicus]
MNNMNITQTDEQLKAETYVCSAQPFELGQCVMTQGVDSLLNDNIGASLQIYLMRHKNGDWGNSPVDDKLLALLRKRIIHFICYSSSGSKPIKALSLGR